MKSIKLYQHTGFSKNEKERLVLFGLVELFIKTGKPIGSNTLREEGFESISSATIRNYFANLEAQGYLEQAHISGGRVPTAKAYDLYASEYAIRNPIPPQDLTHFNKLKLAATREIATFMQNGAEMLSDLTNHAVFVSAPRFDHDFVTDLKIVKIDNSRCLCVLITDFGVVHTHLFHLETKLSAFSFKRIENYFYWRVTGGDRPVPLDPAEEGIAVKLYNEMMVRYIVGYSNFIDEEIYRTGFSKLLIYPDFQDPTLLVNSLALFENTHSMRLMLRDCMAHDTLKFWVGDSLIPYTAPNTKCSVIAIPYYINNSVVGAVGLLGPDRTPYRELFGMLTEYSHSISEALTRSLYKFKITFRQPQMGKSYLQKEERRLLGQSQLVFIEESCQNKTLEGETHDPR